MFATVREGTYDPEKLRQGQAQMEEFAALRARQPGYAGSLTIDAGGGRMFIVALWESERRPRPPARCCRRRRTPDGPPLGRPDAGHRARPRPPHRPPQALRLAPTQQMSACVAFSRCFAPDVIRVYLAPVAAGRASGCVLRCIGGRKRVELHSPAPTRAASRASIAAPPPGGAGPAAAPACPATPGPRPLQQQVGELARGGDHRVVARVELPEAPAGRARRRVEVGGGTPGSARAEDERARQRLAPAAREPERVAGRRPRLRHQSLGHPAALGGVDDPPPVQARAARRHRHRGGAVAPPPWRAAPRLARRRTTARPPRRRRSWRPGRPGGPAARGPGPRPQR